MCFTAKKIVLGVLAAVFGTLFAWLFISALVQQFVNRGELLGSDAGRILAQYFGAMVLLGLAKLCKWKACCDNAPAKKKK